MKRCPKCNRTYADDAFTFCLEDGALLSAAYDPESDKPISTIQSGGPPPTAVLPADSDRKENETRAVPLPPTIASPAVTAGAPELKPFVAAQFETNAVSKKSKRPYIIVSSLALALLGVGGILLIALKSNQCPKVNVYCSSLLNSGNCYLYESGKQWIGIGQPPVPKGVHNLSWSTSAGKIDRQEGGGIIIDTTGNSRRVILVTAKFTSDGWFCSTTATAVFVAE